MKCICVTHKDFTPGLGAGMSGIPEIGEVVTVERETFSIDFIPCYKFYEYSGYVFDRRNFATLPEQSADEMQEESHEALIYQR